MKVQIVSMQAALGGRPSIVWEGDVPIGHTGHYGATNDHLFRFFNRVDESDGKRLAEIGYDLPSLSAGDLIHWHENTWRVDGMGFTRLTRNDEFAMELMLR